MGSFSDESADPLLKPQYILVLTLGACSQFYGISPCTAGRIFSGTATAGGATSITLPAGASAVDGAYNGMVVSLTGGTGSVRKARSQLMMVPPRRPRYQRHGVRTRTAQLISIS